MHGCGLENNARSAGHTVMANGDERLVGRRFISNAPLTGDIDWKVLDTRSLNGLRIKLHKLHELERHAHFDGKTECARFTGGKRVVVCPVSTR